MYRYCFGRCSSELTQLVPRPYSWGKSTHHSDRLHNFSVAIPNSQQFLSSHNLTVEFSAHRGFSLTWSESKFQRQLECVNIWINIWILNKVVWIKIWNITKRFKNLKISKKTKVISSVTYLSIAFSGCNCNVVITAILFNWFRSLNMFFMQIFFASSAKSVCMAYYIYWPIHQHFFIILF